MCGHDCENVMLQVVTESTNLRCCKIQYKTSPFGLVLVYMTCTCDGVPCRAGFKPIRPICSNWLSSGGLYDELTSVQFARSFLMLWRQWNYSVRRAGVMKYEAQLEIVSGAGGPLPYKSWRSMLYRFMLRAVRQSQPKSVKIAPPLATMIY